MYVDTQPIHDPERQITTVGELREGDVFEMVTFDPANPYGPDVPLVHVMAVVAIEHHLGYSRPGKDTLVPDTRAMVAYGSSETARLEHSFRDTVNPSVPQTVYLGSVAVRPSGLGPDGKDIYQPKNYLRWPKAGKYTTTINGWQEPLRH